MRSVFVVLVLLCSMAQAIQMQMPPVPKEFAKVNFFAGKWVGTEKIQGMGGPAMSAKATMTGRKTLDNRYMQSMHVMDMGRAGKMEGMHLVSFDPFKKKFVAFWFDSSSPAVMEMSGDFKGNKLVMVSKPTEIPGVPEPMVMRATWTKVSNSKLTFKLESKQGDKWAPMIDGDFRKIG